MRASLFRRKLMMSAAVVTLMGGTAARAADLGIVEPAPVPVPEAHSCSHQALIAGGVGGSHFWPNENQLFETGPELGNFKSYDYQAEAAWLATCNHWNLQADGAFSGYRTYDTPSGKNSEGTTWHIGGIAFWRDPGHGLLGIDGSYFETRDRFNNFPPYPARKSTDGFRIGLRGEFFASDTVTVGGRVGYLTFEGVDGDFDAFEGDIFARYYANDNLALTARFDGIWVDTNGGGINGAYGLGATAIGEYLIPDTSFSLFAEASYFHWDYDALGPDEDIKVTGLRGMIGAKFYINSPHTTLVGIHRNGPLDNSSFWIEEAHGPTALVPAIDCGGGSC